MHILKSIVCSFIWLSGYLFFFFFHWGSFLENNCEISLSRRLYSGLRWRMICAFLFFSVTPRFALTGSSCGLFHLSKHVEHFLLCYRRNPVLENCLQCQKMYTSYFRNVWLQACYLSHSVGFFERDISNISFLILDFLTWHPCLCSNVHLTEQFIMFKYSMYCYLLRANKVCRKMWKSIHRMLVWNVLLSLNSEMLSQYWWK